MGPKHNRKALALVQEDEDAERRRQVTSVISSIAEICELVFQGVFDALDAVPQIGVLLATVDLECADRLAAVLRTPECQRSLWEVAASGGLSVSVTAAGTEIANMPVMAPPPPPGVTRLRPVPGPGIR